MRKAVVIAALAGALVSAAGTTAAFASQPASSNGGEDPPECVHATISENSGSGPRLYLVFCGSGSYGESPLMDGRKSLVVDGGALKPTDCTKLAPCYVMWPASPQETSNDASGGG